MSASRFPSEFVRDFRGFTQIRELGRGAYGSVWLVEDPMTREQLAVKSFHLGTEADQKAVISFFREIEALLALRHPCIVPIVGFFPVSADLPAQIPVSGWPRH